MAEPIVPNLRAVSGLLLEKIFTVIIPIIEHTRPKDANASGINCNTDLSQPNEFTVALVMDAASAMEAIMEPQ